MSTGLPPDAFDDVVVATQGHPGWTRGSFSVGADGTGNYHIPLWTPAGRAGIQPNLSLEYSTRAGDSIIGMGWNLGGLSAITRCQRTRGIDGETGAVSFDEDVFCLDGARLVTADPAAIGGLTGRLRPIRNSASIVSWTGTLPQAPDSFTVQDPSGRRSTYARQVSGTRYSADQTGDPGADIGRSIVPDGEVTYAWLLTRVEDLAGNYMTFDYEDVPHGPADFSAAEVRPYLIRYTGHGTTDGQRWVFLSYEPTGRPADVRFVSGLPLASSDHLARVLAYGPDSLVPARTYELEYAESGGTHRSLLSSVEECDGEGVCREPVTLEYSEGGLVHEPASDTGVMLVPGSRWHGANDPAPMATIDVDGSGAEMLLVPVGTGGVVDGYWHTLSSSGIVDRINVDWDDDVYPFDLDGDGRAEILRQPSYSWEGPADIETLSEGLSGSTRTWSASSLFTVPQCSIGDAGSLGLADVSGEGFPRFVTQCRSTGALRWSGLSTRGAMYTAWQESGAAGGLRPFQAISLDASGRSTILYRREATTSEPVETIIQVPFGTATGVNLLTANLDPEGRWVFLDVNADGLADALDLRCPREHPENPADPGELTNFTLRINMGGFFGPAMPALEVSPTNPGYEYADVPDVRIADFNGDGRADLGLLVHGWGGTSGSSPEYRFPFAAHDALMVHLSNGRGFTTAGGGNAGESGDAVYRLDPDGILPGESSGPSLGVPYTRVSWPMSQLFDPYGEGDTYMAFNPTSWDANGLTHDHLYVRRIYAGTPDLLVSAHRGERTQVEVTYSRERYLAGDCSAPEGPVTCGSRPTTVSVVTDEVGREYHHFYFGPRFDVEGQGWLGFTRHLETEYIPATGEGRSVDTYFDLPEAIDSQGQASPTGDAQYGTRYATVGRPRVVLRIEPLADGFQRVRAQFMDYEVPPADGRFPIAELAHEYEREWDRLSTSWTAPPFEASPPLDIYSFPLPAAAPTRAVNRSFEYAAYGFAIPEQVTETVPGLGTTVTTAVTHADFANWLLAITDSVTVTSSTGDGHTQTRTSSFEWGHPLPGGGVALPHLLRRSIREPLDTGGLYQLREFKHDDRGLVTSVAIADHDGTRREVTIDYDYEGVYPERVLNPLGHEQWFGYDAALGVPVYERDERDVETRRHFDRFGRLRDASGHGTEVELEYLDSAGDGTEIEVVSRALGAPESRTTGDAFGRTLRSRQQGFAGWVESIPTYDEHGRVRRVEEPHAESTLAQSFAEVEYDGSDRVTRVDFSDGTNVLMAYLGATSTSTNRRGHVTTTTTDLAGRVVTVEEAAADSSGNTQPTSLHYVYGPFGQVRRMYDQSTFAWTWDHDAYGRLVAQHDPDAGDRFFRYDGFDQLDAELEAAAGPERTSYTHDLLGRVELVESTVDGTVSYEWDTTQVGLLTLATRLADDVARLYEYDEFGRLSAETTYVSGEEYRIDTEYDSAGRTSAIVYPEVDGARRTIGYEYDAVGFLTRVYDGSDTLWTGDEYDANGRLRHATDGSGTTTELKWGAENPWLESIEVRTVPDGLVMNQVYGHDANGNVDSRTDLTLTVGGTQTFEYDLLDRVRSRTVDGVLEQFTYDDRGNMTGIAGRTQTYSPTVPHQLATSGGSVIEHDDRGRMTQGPDWTIAQYTDFDLPRDVTRGGVTSEFHYDADGDRVATSTGVRRTVSIRGLYEYRTGDLPAHTWNVQVGGQTIAQYVRSAGITRLVYLHSDGLGSPTLVTDADGNVVERYGYEVYGDQSARDSAGAFSAVPTPAERATFTGHDADPELGLINMRGRMYDPTIGRFLSPDPIVHSAANRQAWNPYSYVSNNPLTNVDPTGFDWWQGCYYNWFNPLWQPDSSGTGQGDVPWGNGAVMEFVNAGPARTEFDPNAVSSGGAPPPLPSLAHSPVRMTTYDSTLTRFMGAHASVQTSTGVGVEFAQGEGRVCPSCHDDSGMRQIGRDLTPGEFDAFAAFGSVTVIGTAAPVVVVVAAGGFEAVGGAVGAQLTLIRLISIGHSLADSAVGGFSGGLTSAAGPPVLLEGAALGAGGVAASEAGRVVFYRAPHMRQLVAWEETGRRWFASAMYPGRGLFVFDELGTAGVQQYARHYQAGAFRISIPRAAYDALRAARQITVDGVLDNAFAITPQGLETLGSTPGVTVEHIAQGSDDFLLLFGNP